jgi:hypothetical protein
LILFKLKTYMTYMFDNVFDKMLLFVELSERKQPDKIGCLNTIWGTTMGIQTTRKRKNGF